jgi:hypothetical protein
MMVMLSFLFPAHLVRLSWPTGVQNEITGDGPSIEFAFVS